MIEAFIVIKWLNLEARFNSAYNLYTLLIRNKKILMSKQFLTLSKYRILKCDNIVCFRIRKIHTHFFINVYVFILIASVTGKLQMKVISS